MCDSDTWCTCTPGGLVWALRPLTLHHYPFLVRHIIANLILTLTLTLTLTLSLTLTLILL